MLKARKRIWRESRVNGLSNTQYSGLELYLGDFDGFVLVSKLSHGIRVIDANDRNKFVFDEPEEVEIEISDDFYNEVLHFFTADRHFQSVATSEFNKLMS